MKQKRNYLTGRTTRRRPRDEYVTCAQGLFASERRIGRLKRQLKRARRKLARQLQVAVALIPPTEDEAVGALEEV